MAENFKKVKKYVKGETSDSLISQWTNAVTVEFNDGKSYVYFKVGGRGIGPRNEILKGFEVAGEDRVFYPATAETTKRDCIVVKCPQVKNPVAVRYGFRNWCEASVFSTAGIPASPFRTDNW